MKRIRLWSSAVNQYDIVRAAVRIREAHSYAEVVARRLQRELRDRPGSTRLVEALDLQRRVLDELDEAGRLLNGRPEPPADGWGDLDLGAEGSY